ncbi:MAG: TetR/AcrR family transcriptional regulator [Clostridiales bacterium]|nr:TetR/AcrR family transcriptional regulator [Clostridiales bacterium]
MKKQPDVTEKTRKKFEDAFWTLAAEKPISKIAVSEIAKRAGYNRSTFYEYFEDTDDLLSRIEAEMIEEVKQIILPALPEIRSLENLFPITFSAMNEKMYLLMGPNGDSAFPAKLKAELIPLIVSYIPISTDMPNFDYIISFVNSALFGLVQHWHEMDKDISTEKICTIMQNLVLYGLRSYVDPAAQGTDE